jgi:hypothetical protein
VVQPGQTIMPIKATLGASLVLCLMVQGLACPPARYNNFYLNVTHYRIDENEAATTPAGIKVLRADQPVDSLFLLEVDRLTGLLDTCLQAQGFAPIQRTWFGVYVPANWYVSACSGEQLVPSTPPCQGCLDKSLPIPRNAVVWLNPRLHVLVSATSGPWSRTTSGSSRLPI